MTLVLGASRGIGLELVRQISEQGKIVYGTVRSKASENASALKTLAAKSDGKIRVFELELTSAESAAALAKELENLDPPVERIIFNAGIGTGASDGPGPSSKEVDIKEFSRHFENNVVAFITTLRELVPLLEKSPTPASSVKKIFLMSSDAASMTISEREWAPAHYCVSKAALNMLGRCLCKELRPKKIAVTMVHPGWVRTDMGGDNADISVEESVSGMVQLFDDEKLTGLESTGGYYDYEKKVMPW